MDITTLFVLAVALGTDAFSLSIGIGLAGINFRKSLLLSITILIFHIVMPLIGYVTGAAFGSLLGKMATIIGALILIYLGIKMTVESIRSEDGNQTFVIANFLGLILLAGSVSLDALSVGFTLGIKQAALGMAVFIIGLVAGLMTFTGLEFGKKIGTWVGGKAEIMGGLILIVIGIKLFF